MMKTLLTTLFFITSLQAWATPTPEQPDRNEAEYNLDGQLGLKGFDPVAYFAEHGGEALQGNPNISAEYGNVVYRFASEDNRSTFLNNPTKYEPTYGGWCAWAMANRSFVDINPMLFTQNGNRMHFFISAGAKARFDNDLARREKDADDYFESQTGEKPRL
ncbi:MAG: hypothetical protein KDD33_13805 [Bdellovibrionales bacterium]|nr:hypothetical protein [Bdellovibrionales bacterium]